MLANPASFTRTLDLSAASYDGGTGDGAFFNDGLQAVILAILNAGWTINLPFGGAVDSPYVAVATFPDLSNINGTYYAQSGDSLYSSISPESSTADMSNLGSIASFPLTTVDGDNYFTYGPDESYYYYSPA
jgi:hypothetical protein